MKHLLSIGAFAIFSLNLVGQTNPQTLLFKKSFLDSAAFNGWEYKDSLRAFDLGMLWTQKDNSLLLAFIGKHYQRMRVKILSATKDPAYPFTYTISGKCMLRDTVRLFAGTVKIIAGRTLRQKSTGLDEDFLNKIREEGVLMAIYNLREDSSQENAGAFSGLLRTGWYIDRQGRLKYDDIENYSDGYCNNQFVGVWQAYNADVKETCNWGDRRIPFSDSLDVGAGEFSPAEAYLKYGWRTYHDAEDGNSPQAQKIEDEKWWK